MKFIGVICKHYKLGVKRWIRTSLQKRCHVKCCETYTERTIFEIGCNINYEHSLNLLSLSYLHYQRKQLTVDGDGVNYWYLPPGTTFSLQLSNCTVGIH